jgi:hypothetical protein
LEITLLSHYNIYDEDDLITLSKTLDGIHPDYSKILEAINDKGIRDQMITEYNIIYETFQKWNNKN